MDAALRQKLDQAQISEQLKKDADAALKKICIGPFEKHVKKKVPHITVSSESRADFNISCASLSRTFCLIISAGGIRGYTPGFDQTHI